MRQDVARPRPVHAGNCRSDNNRNTDEHKHPH
jgi:hypothetical protein